jgi:hypothetical protein
MRFVLFCVTLALFLYLTSEYGYILVSRYVVDNGHNEVPHFSPSPNH